MEPGAGRIASGHAPQEVNVLLDTHFVLWAALGADRLREFPWLNRYRPWCVSPVSLLEIQFLAEVGRLELDDQFFDVLAQDGRFMIDEPPLASLVAAAMPLTWTRDPFDRLLVAHSLHRRTPLCSVDRTVRAHHKLMAKELRA